MALIGNEQVLDFIVMFFWLFVFTNINQVLGIGYAIFLGIYMWMREEGKKKDVVYPVSKGKVPSIWLTVTIAGILALGFLYISNGFFPGGGKIIGQALMASFALSSLPLPVALLIGGPLVAYTEEKFFRGGLLPIIQIKIKNDLFAAVVDGAAFALWHLGVYKITNNPALLLAGSFGTIMSLVVLRQNDLKYNIVAHSIFNTIVLLLASGITSISLGGLGATSLCVFGC